MEVEVDDQGMCQGELNPKTNTHRSGSANCAQIGVPSQVDWQYALLASAVIM